MILAVKSSRRTSERMQLNVVLMYAKKSRITMRRIIIRSTSPILPQIRTRAVDQDRFERDRNEASCSEIVALDEFKTDFKCWRLHVGRFLYGSLRTKLEKVTFFTRLH